MIRSRLLMTTMQRLAALAVLLMLVAPLVSRWVQTQREMALGAMCTAQGMEMSAVLPMMGMVHDMSGMAHDMRGGYVHGEKGGGHADGGMATHEEACEYCALAARLLPLLLVLVLLAPLLYRQASPLWRAFVFVAGVHWPAHPARGPPLFS